MKRTDLLLAGALWCLAGTGSGGQTAPPPAGTEESAFAIDGMVLDVNGKPLAGAGVFLVRAEPVKQLTSGQVPATPYEEGILAQARSDEAGAFSLPPATENFLVVVRADGRSVAWAGPWGPLFPGKRPPHETGLEFRLEKGLEVSGLVLDGPGGRPLADAEVWVFPDQVMAQLGAFTPPAMFAARARTGADGRYVLRGVVAGPSSVLVRAQARVTRVFSADAREGTILPAVALGPGGRVTGKVLDADQKGVPAARVDLVSQEQGTTRRRSIEVSTGKDTPAWELDPFSARADGSGVFEISGVPMGASVVSARASGYTAGDPVTLQIKAGTPPPMTLRLRRGTRVRLQVIREGSGEPVQDVRAVVLSSPKTPAFLDASDAEGLSGADGRIEIQNVEPGNHYLHLLPVDGKPPGPMMFNLQPGERDRDLGILSLRPGETVAGAITGPDGSPVAGVRVTTDVAHFKSATSAADGTFRLRGLDAGEMELSFRGEGWLDQHVNVRIPAAEALTVVMRPAAGLRLTAHLPAADGGPGAVAETVRIRLHPADEGDGDGTSAWERIVGRGSTDLEPAAQGDGVFTLTGLEPGLRHVEVFVPEGRPVLRESVRLQSGEVADLGDLILPEPRVVRGRLLDAASRVPVADASILVLSENLFANLQQDLERAATSDALGEFQVGAADGAAGQLRIEHPDYAPLTVALNSLEAVNGKVEILLRHGGTVVGHVKGMPEPDAAAAGDAGSFPAAFVQLRSEAGGVAAMAMGGGGMGRIQPDGSYRVERVPAGTYTVLAAVRNGAAFRQTEKSHVEVRDGATVQVDLEFAGASLTGRLEMNGVPLPGAYLVFVPPGENSTAIRQTQTGDDGTFSVDGVEPGPCSVLVVRPDKGTTHVRASVAPQAGGSPWLIGLGSAALQVQVEGLTGGEMQTQLLVLSPDPSATVTMVNPFAGFRTVVQVNLAAAAAGPIVVEGLEPGTYTLRLLADARSADLPQASTASGQVYRITLAEGMEADARVTDAQGQPLSGAVVMALGPHGEGPATLFGVTDVTGMAHSSSLNAGQHVVVAWVVGAGTSLPVTLDIRSGGSARADLQIGPTGGLDVTVAAGGQPQAGLRVDLVRDGIVLTDAYAGSGMASFVGANPVTDAAGVARYRQIPPGDWLVRVDGPLGHREGSVTVSAGVTAGLSLSY